MIHPAQSFPLQFSAEISPRGTARGARRAGAGGREKGGPKMAEEEERGKKYRVRARASLHAGFCASEEGVRSPGGMGLVGSRRTSDTVG